MNWDPPLVANWSKSPSFKFKSHVRIPVGTNGIDIKSLLYQTNFKRMFMLKYIKYKKSCHEMRQEELCFPSFTSRTILGMIVH